MGPMAMLRPAGHDKVRTLFAVGKSRVTYSLYGKLPLCEYCWRFVVERNACPYHNRSTTKAIPLDDTIVGKTVVRASIHP